MTPISLADSKALWQTYLGSLGVTVPTTPPPIIERSDAMFPLFMTELLKIVGGRLVTAPITSGDIATAAARTFGRTTP